MRLKLYRPHGHLFWPEVCKCSCTQDKCALHSAHNPVQHKIKNKMQCNKSEQNKKVKGKNEN